MTNTQALAFKQPPSVLPSIIPMIGGKRLIQQGLSVIPGCKKGHYNFLKDGSVRRATPKMWANKSERRQVIKARHIRF